MRTRSVDHFTESGINPATRPQDALIHEKVDHFISLLVLYMSVGVAPLMWKRDVAQAFRKVPSSMMPRTSAGSSSYMLACCGRRSIWRCPSGPRLPIMRGTV